MTLRERRRIQQRQLGKSACAKHPDQRLAMRHRESWCVGCDAKPVNLVRLASETERYLTGDTTQHAAMRSKLRDKYGEIIMTTEALMLRDPTSQEITQAGERFAAQLPSFDPNAWKALPDSDKVLAARLSLAGFRPDHFTV
ncbi:hypothetical protein LCGC14_2731700, partial [marine sediment metagenome]